jgi:hypothetical protein
MDGGPNGAEPQGIAPATLEARAVTGCECRCLVEKKQLGIAPRSHDLALAVFERQDAADPLTRDPSTAAERSMCVVKCATAVPHHQAASRMRDDVAFRRHSVLERHGVICHSLLEERAGRDR